MNDQGCKGPHQRPNAVLGRPLVFVGGEIAASQLTSGPQCVAAKQQTGHVNEASHPRGWSQQRSGPFHQPTSHILTFSVGQRHESANN
eukprot:2832724-Prorocentrum_lima.AAC.1